MRYPSTSAAASNPNDPRLRDALSQGGHDDPADTPLDRGMLTAAGLMAGLAVAAHAGVGQAHSNVALTPMAVEYAVMLAV